MIAIAALVTYLALIAWAVVKLDRADCRGCRIERDEKRRVKEIRARRVGGRA